MTTKRTGGFTLVEIMIVVAIVGLLAAIALPSFARSRRETMVTRTANDLRVFGDAFALYAMEQGRYPADVAQLVLPPGMEEYIKLSKWVDCPMGTGYNWEGPTWGESGIYPYAGISLADPIPPLAMIRMLDQKIDDGSLSTGKFRQTSNARYTYIIEE